MLGGGSFNAQNKALPGAYINFVSAAKSLSFLSDRGVAAVPLFLDWGPEKQIMEVTAQEFAENCFNLFGHQKGDPEMLPLRELFCNLTKGILYRINGGTAASNIYGTARYTGSRGNVITIVISKNIADETKYDVRTLFAGKEVNRQTVGSAAELADTEYMVFKKDATLTETAGAPFTGGADAEEATGEDYANFLTAVESRSFHVLACPSTDENVKSLFTAYTKRMRDEAGVKFQTVLYRGNKADYEGIISVENKASGMESGLVYWVAGAAASCAVNKTNENKKYDGELSVDTGYTQLQLSDGVQEGKFMFHLAGEEVRVLMDINTLTTFTEEKGEDFGSNQTVRVLDQMGNDIAYLFNSRYLGNVPNDEAGRISLWNDVVNYYKELGQMRAIEAVDVKSILVQAGNTKRSVAVSCPVTPINCMSQLYMTVVVS